MKIRLIGAHIALPDKLVKNENFRNRKIDVNAIIVDYVFGQHFDGWWIGTGFEIWQNSIEYAPNGTTAEWTTSVLTAGGGYIFRFYDNLYINPWGALHYVLNAREIRQDVDTYKENAFQYSASLKIGYFFDM